MDTGREGTATVKQNDTVYNEFVEDLKKQYDTSAPSPIETVKTEDYEKISQLLGEFVSYPYDVVAVNTNNDCFKLTPTEKSLNAMVTKMMILYYLPMIDLGKLSLIAFIVFNVGLIATKISFYRKQTKKEGMPQKKVKPVNPQEQDRKDAQVAEVEAGITSDLKKAELVPIESIRKE